MTTTEKMLVLVASALAVGGLIYWRRTRPDIAAITPHPDIDTVQVVSLRPTGAVVAGLTAPPSADEPVFRC